MNFFRVWAVGGLMLGMLCGCGQPRNLFVLLPEEDGSVGKLSVSNPHGVQVLNQAWQATGMNPPDEAPRAPETLAAETVAKEFGAVLAGQPQPPIRFILYFQQDSTELTEASKAQLPEVLAAIRDRHSVDTSVVGHTDTVGTNEYNVQLSRKRAEIIARQLIKDGVDPAILEVSSHGERNPLIPTKDGVFEPRNRRVEVTVR